MVVVKVVKQMLKLGVLQQLIQVVVVVDLKLMVLQEQQVVQV